MIITMRHDNNIMSLHFLNVRCIFNQNINFNEIILVRFFHTQIK